MSAHVERARLLIGQHRFELAEKELGLALAEQPDDAVAHALMGFCLASRDRFDTALPHAREAVARAPDFWFAHYCLARVQLMRNDVSAAETAARQSIALAPNESRGHVLLGEIRLHQSRWQESRESAEQALALDPEDVNAKNVRAHALRQMGQAGSAEAELRSSLAVDPEDAWTHANMGWTLLQAGRRDEAMNHFREALRLQPELDSARAGVVETLKAGNVFYRMILQYFFWMASLGRRGQWGVILGAWFGYMILRRVAEATPAARPWVMPLVVAYLVFVVVSWLAVPLANLALRLHPFGRLALSRDERIASNWLGGFLLAAMLSGVAALLAPGIVPVYAPIYFGLMLLPLAATFNAEAPWPRKPLKIYTTAVAAAGALAVLGTLLPIPDPDTASLPWLLTMIVVALCTVAFPLLAVLSLFAGNILSSIRWKK